MSYIFNTKIGELFRFYICIINSRNGNILRSKTIFIPFEWDSRTKIEMKCKIMKIVQQQKKRKKRRKSIHSILITDHHSMVLLYLISFISATDSLSYIIVWLKNSIANAAGHHLSWVHYVACWNWSETRKWMIWNLESFHLSSILVSVDFSWKILWILVWFSLVVLFLH